MDIMSCILNSSVFYWFFKNVSNCRDFSLREISAFPIGDISKLPLADIGNKLKNSYKSNRVIK